MTDMDQSPGVVAADRVYLADSGTAASSTLSDGVPIVATSGHEDKPVTEVAARVAWSGLARPSTPKHPNRPPSVVRRAVHAALHHADTKTPPSASLSAWQQPTASEA